jgi:cholesterol oxidase
MEDTMNETHSAPSQEGPSSNRRATQWLSRGFEELIHARQSDSARDETTADYAVVIVGSGYGGAVAAAELAAHRAPNQKVCVLERGREYLQGSFPSRMSDLAKHVRFTGPGASKPSGYREGLFDVRVGKDVSTVLANGVGGGSLINAGVMAMPESSVLMDAAWPENMRDQAAADELVHCSESLRARLGATHAIDDKDVNDPLPYKFDALRQIASGHKFKSVPITIALTDKASTNAGVNMSKCVRCGDCATGCNHNAKLSLDVTLLAEAVQFGAEIYAGVTLLRIDKQRRPDQPPLWRLHLVHTDAALRRRQNEPFVLRADHVVLAAGTLGSTEILMRSECDDLQFSKRLGHQFSANGDLIAAAYSTDAVANCAGDETRQPDQVPPEDRVGPTITGLVDLRQNEQMVIEDLGVPGPLRRLFEEVLTTTAALHLLGESDEAPHDPDSSSGDPCPVDPDQIRKSLLVVMMSRDPADGVLGLKGGHSHNAGDGAIGVHWPRLRDHPPFLDHHRVLQELLDQSPVRGRVLPYPIWRPLPNKLDYLLAGKNGPLVTVHPLGGCPMGSTPMNGVVDHLGRVFDRSSPGNQTHEGLAVLDGSIIPTSLGINPALTIASVALRAVTSLRQEWGFTHQAQSNKLSPRPIFRIPQVLEHPRPSEIEVLERLSGSLPLRGFERDAHVELTMRFEPIEVRKLSVLGARLNLPAEGGKLRIFSKPPRDDVEAKDERALLVATVSGSLRLFHREHSTPLQRRLRGLWAWFRNRGLRDSVLWLLDYIKNDAVPAGETHGFFGQVVERLRGAWRLGSRAGAVRLIEYDLTIQEILYQQPRLPEHGDDFKGKVIRGCKRLTYSRRSNPWRQLMEVGVQEFPTLAPIPAAPILKLDTGFLARQGVPLMRVVGQQDQPAALAELSSLALYLLRMLLHVHVWSFRAPDTPKAREIRRLPGSVPGLPAPVCIELPVDVLADGRPVMVRLTHYGFGQEQRERALRRQPDAEPAILAPVLMIHGYSASGTTFAHHAVRPNLASALWDEGRDVWIVDMRTIAGMPHARHPWSFEEVARADIPVAIGHVLSTTGRAQLDVFAHCMGSAMLGMALLGPRHNDERFWPLRDKLHQKIRCLAMSQVAPAMVFTPANVFRAYAMRFLKHYLPTGHYEFRTSRDPGIADQLLDRLLATLPYPEAEFDRENPFWTPWRRTPWVGTRHRMDALYGRDFSLNNLPQGVLDHIDDHFGPLSIETVSQAIHFARFKTITNHRGFNEFLSPHQLRECYDFPMLSVHGDDNGLVSVRTLKHFSRVLKDAGAQRLRRARYEGFGHQDCLIGVGADRVFGKVIDFFNSVPPRLPKGQTATASQSAPVFSSQVPAFGLRWDPAAPHGRIGFSTGDRGGRGRPLLGIFVPVAWRERLQLVGKSGEMVEPSRDAFIDLVKVSGPHPIDELDEHTRVRFAFDRSHLPQEADGLLVMLMYLQSFEIGGDARLADIDMVSLREAANLLLDLLPANAQSRTALAAPSDAAAPPGSPGLEGLQKLIQDILDAMGLSVHRAYTESSAATLKLGMLRPPP